MRKLIITVAIVGLLAALLVPLTVGAQAGGTWVSSIQVMNVGTGPASVKVHFYAEAGNEVTLVQNTALAVGSSWNIYTPDISGLTAGFKGSVVVESDQPVVAIGSENVTYSNGNIGVSQFSGMAASDIGLNFYLPNVNKTFGGSGWSTRITIQNATTAANAVTVRYYNGDGTERAAAVQTVNLAANGSATLEQSANTNLPTGWLGAATVTGGGDVAVVVDVMSADGRLETYNGIDAGDMTLFIPTLLSGFGSNLWNTSFQVFNPSSTLTANITIDYYTSGSATPVKTVTAALGPLQAINRYQPNDGLGSGWIGSVRIVSSDNPVVAVASQSSGAAGTSKASIYNAFGSGATTAYLPTVLRNFGGSNYVTSFQIMNVGATPASVTVQYFTPGSTTPVKTVNLSIDPYNSVNRYQPDADPELGAGWQGSVKVTSDVAVVVIGSQNALNRSGDTVGQYDGFAVAP